MKIYILITFNQFEKKNTYVFTNFNIASKMIDENLFIKFPVALA